MGWWWGRQDSPSKKRVKKELEKKKRKDWAELAMDVLAVKERAPNQIDASCITSCCRSQDRLPACRVDAPPHASRRSTQFTSTAKATHCKSKQASKSLVGVTASACMHVGMNAAAVWTRWAAISSSPRLCVDGSTQPRHGMAWQLCDTRIEPVS